VSGPASKTSRKARRITKGLSALLYGRQAVDIWCMPQTRALNDVRRELEGLEYARLTDSTPARDARHKELCLREVQLLGRQGVTCTENCVGLPSSPSSQVDVRLFPFPAWSFGAPIQSDSQPNTEERRIDE
jgi:hypothetical protein